MSQRVGIAPYLQAAPFALIFLLFLVIPLVFIVVVSFWQYTDYSIEPAFDAQNYVDVFDRCITRLPTLCTTFKTYLSTLQFCATVWAITLVIGFTVAYFVAFEVRTPEIQSAP